MPDFADEERAVAEDARLAFYLLSPIPANRRECAPLLELMAEWGAWAWWAADASEAQRAYLLGVAAGLDRAREIMTEQSAQRTPGGARPAALTAAGPGEENAIPNDRVSCARLIALIDEWDADARQQALEQRGSAVHSDYLTGFSSGLTQASNILTATWARVGPPSRSEVAGAHQLGLSGPSELRPESRPDGASGPMTNEPPVTGPHQIGHSTRRTP